MLYVKLKVVYLILLFVKISKAQYDYGETTEPADYPYPVDYDYETQPTDTQAPEETPAATVLPNGGVDPGLEVTTIVDYSNYDVITEPPIVVNPTTTRPCNRVPKMIINWYLLGHKTKTPVRRNVQPMRRPSAGYGMPWSSFYGYNRSRYVVRKRPAARHISSGGSSSGRVVRYFWRV
ncbi:uncharacterized protein LOC128093668 [Culex pipiens pallens]|uniref:uncharacterized protein LOC128093668 n=1 Tax=Culex pipiens pallens TaxID=42434 RepID=UPI0022AAEA1E|nr:uncharacterized protein LOC128093668 [Culex pipiens pallens]